MIKVEGLTKRYGDLKAAEDISFYVKKGEILRFLGPNGESYRLREAKKRTKRRSPRKTKET